MPWTKPATNGVALPTSATAKKRAFIPSVVNPYAEFTQPQFDAFVSDITTKIRDALHGGRKKDKGKGKDMSLFGRDASTTSVQQGDAMGFEQFSFSTKVRNGLNGPSPLDAADVLTDEEEQDEDTEQEEVEGVNGGVNAQILRPSDDEEQETSEPPQVITQGAGGANDPIVIDLLDSDEEEPQVNGMHDVGQGGSQYEESSDEEDEDENVPEPQQNNLIVIDSDEESEHDVDPRVLFQESDQLNIGEARIEERVGDALPASSPAPDDQDDEEEHNDDTELDHMQTAYETFVANMNASGPTMPYAEGPDLHAGTSGYSSEITDYYSLYPYDNTTQVYVDPLRSSSQSAKRARQKATNEEGMSWTHPPAFPSRGDSDSGHGAYQSEEPQHQLFPVSAAGYGIPTNAIASYAGTHTADGYAPVDETQYHSVYQAEQSFQQLPMGSGELTSGVPFDIYGDLAIDPSLDASGAVNDVPQSTSIEGVQSDVYREEPAVKEPKVDVPATTREESEEEEGVVEEAFEIPTIEIDATDVDPLSLETTFGTGVLAPMLTPELRHLMELPPPISPTVDLFPTHEKSQNHQISEVDLVDSEQLLTPDGAIHPLQKLGGLVQAVSNSPYVKRPEETSPTIEPVFKNSQLFIETLETLKAELDTPKQALTISITDPAVQDATAPLLISATSERPSESDQSALAFDEESQAFGYTDEKFEFQSTRGSSVLSSEPHLDPFEQDTSVSPQIRKAKQGTSRNNGLSRELQRLQDGAGTIVIDGPRLRRTTSSKSGGPPAANSSVRGPGRRGASKQPSPRKRARTPMTSMPPPSDVPKRNRRGSSRASSAASDQSVQKPPSKSPSLDYRTSPFEPRLDTTLRAGATSSAGSTPTKKRKRRLSVSMPGDDEDYVPEEVEQTHKKRKTEIHDAIEADSSLVGIDLGEALAVAGGTPDLKAKGAVGDEGSPRNQINTSPSTLYARTAVNGSAEDDKRHHSTTQLNGGHSDSDSLSGDSDINTHEASSPSKHIPKRRWKPMDPQHNSYKPLTDSDESESEGESTSRHESIRRKHMQNGDEAEVEEPVQNTRRSTPMYEGILDESTSDISDTDGSLFSDTVGSTEESTTIVDRATEEPEVKVNGLEPQPKSDRHKSRRMRRIQRDNLAYKPSPSSESEGDVEELLEQEEMKERRRRRLRALRKARRTWERKAALAGENVVDGDTSIKSRKRKRPSEHVNERENGKSEGIEVVFSVGDSEPKKKRVKKDHRVDMDKPTSITNGVQKSDPALQVGPVESDLKFAEPLKPPDHVDLMLASHKSVVVPDVPFPITDEKDKSETGVGWFGRLFSKKST